MSIFDKIKGVVGTVFPPAGLAMDIIGKVAGITGKSKEELAGLEPEIAALVVQRDAARDAAIEESYQMETAAKQAVMVAELKQGDMYTKRARPTVVYGGLVVLAVNHVVLPWVAHFAGQQVPAIEIPAIFWTGWAGIVGTYSIGRTMEKRGNPNNVANNALSKIGL